jgi:transcriptional regulator with XRE-family HTH domain
MEDPRNQNEVWQRVAEKIRKERRRLKLTIEQLAELADISPSFLSYLESNKKKASVKTLQRLAEALLLHPGDLIQPSASDRSPFHQDAVREFSRLIRDTDQDDISRALAVLRALLKKPAARRGH